MAVSPPGGSANCFVQIVFLRIQLDMASEHRGTSLTKNHPSLGLYSRIMPRVLEGL